MKNDPIVNKTITEEDVILQRLRAHTEWNQKHDTQNYIYHAKFEVIKTHGTVEVTFKIVSVAELVKDGKVWLKEWPLMYGTYVRNYVFDTNREVIAVNSNFSDLW